MEYLILLSIFFLVCISVSRCVPYQKKETKIKINEAENGCSCVGERCSCCAHLDIPKVHLNDTGCVVVEYLPQALGVLLELTLDGRLFIKKEVSLRNPPAICVAIPHLKKYASICVDIYNVTWSEKVGACLKIQAKLAGILVEDVPVGCFFYPLQYHRSLFSKLVSLLRKPSTSLQGFKFSWLKENERKPSSFKVEEMPRLVL